VLVWGQIRKIVARARRLTIARRDELDARIGASSDRFRSMDPDHVIDAIEQAATEIEGAARAERAEDRRAEDEFLAVQPDFDGGIRLYGELGPLSGAIVTNALDARTGRREHDATAAGRPTSRAKDDAAALVSLCADDLAGGDREGPAKPLVLVGVQLDQIDVTAAGTIDLDVPGVLPTITARTLEALAQDADLRAVIFDGATPLAVSKKTTAPDIPADTRLAVWLRDRTCRFPGSRRPASSSHVHHLVEREHGGDHHPDNLALIADTVHLAVLHRHGWRTHLDPTDGTLTATRGARTLRSLPRWRGLDRPDANGEERAPPPPGTDPPGTDPPGTG
jgi:hypothetical protein